MELYKTIKKEVSETQIIERSRFIAHAKPVESREEAEDFVARIRADYRDATHNVPAMVIGEKSQIQWASDDGEPKGTAGAPIVQMIVNEGLTNLVVVVTRYFGGIKLGTGGLVRAYTGSAKLALEAAGVRSVCQMCRIEVVLDYTHLAAVQKLAVNGEYEIDGISYGEKVTAAVITTLENEEKVKKLLADITSGCAEIAEVTFLNM